jgi:hypothetical protein
MAARADSRALVRVFEMQLAIVQTLADKDARLCVDFLYGGTSKGFFDFSAANRDLVAEMAIAGLEAISSGETNKIVRSAPNEKDFQLLEQALRDKGLDTEEIEAILDGKSTEPPIPDARMCGIGQIYLETLATMPEPERLRIYGLALELMARS